MGWGGGETVIFYKVIMEEDALDTFIFLCSKEYEEEPDPHYVYHQRSRDNEDLAPIDQRVNVL